MWSHWNISIYDVRTILNVCLFAAWLAGVACILHLMYHFVREYTYMTVNCWFCNINIKVPFKERNEWFCTHCQQFNGFNKDGDYSKPIPEQYNENMNIKNVTSSIPRNSSLNPSNGLCRICNANQDLKIRQIALYVPFREEEYDREIELFKEKLEKSYKLCSICERTVQSTLKLKSSLYSSKVPTKTQNYLRRVASQPVHSRRWKYFILLFSATVFVTYVLRFYNLVNFNDFPAIEVVEKLKKRCQNFSAINIYFNYDTVTTITLTVFVVIAINFYCTRNVLLGSILFGFIVWATSSHASLTFKLGAIIPLFVYSSYKWLKRNRSVVSFQKLNKCEQFGTEYEKNEPLPKNTSTLSNELTMNSPLCGRFSGLTLGQSHSISAKSHTSSYLFKSNKRLIQPSRLNLDDTDHPSDTNCSSPTVSSGYESVSSFLRRSPDSISEFDSVSQVSNYRSNFIRQEPNALSRYCLPYNSSYFPTPDRYYGASPVSSSANQSNTSCDQKPELNAFFSTLQIFFCSLAFFVLGFSFQLLITHIKFY